jgi:hypothetical protein
MCSVLDIHLIKASVTSAVGSKRKNRFFPLITVQTEDYVPSMCKSYNPESGSREDGEARSYSTLRYKIFFC